MPLVNEKHFDDLIHKFIFSAYHELYNKNLEFSMTNVISMCVSYGVEQKHTAYIEESLSKQISKEETLFFAEKLHKKYLIKESIELHHNCIGNLANLSGLESVSDIFNISEASIFDLVSKYTGICEQNTILLGEVVDQVLDNIRNNPNSNIGLPTPWPQFNESIGGGLRTGVALIGSRSGVGKTFLGTVCATFLTQKDVPVLYLDSEMEYQDILPRILSNISEVPIKTIESGSFVHNESQNLIINETAKVLHDLPFHYRSIAGKSFDEVVGIVRRWLYTHVGIKPDGKVNQCLIIYDYFKLMNTSQLSDMSEYQALGFQISQLTDFCKKYSFPCLAFVQLNRDGEVKETSDVIAQSDRLLWLANSFTLFKIKSKEELIKEQYKYGNRKLVTKKSRFGGEHYGEQYISIMMKADIGQIMEVEHEQIPDNQIL